MIRKVVDKSNQKAFFYIYKNRNFYFKLFMEVGLIWILVRVMRVDNKNYNYVHLVCFVRFLKNLNLCQNLFFLVVCSY